jgi:hypothetical protein
VKEDDDRAGGLAHDLVDEVERMGGAFTESDERDVGALASGHGAHICCVDLSRDHLVAQRDHDRGDQRQAILALVGDEDAQVVGFAVAHQRLQPTQV